MTPRTSLLISSLLSPLVLLAPVVVRAEDLDTIFNKVKELAQAQNYTKAIEELSWANKELEKLNAQRIESFFPAEVAGYTAGKAEHNSALGFSTMERSYQKSGAAAIKLSLTGGSGGGAAGGLGGLAAFGKMAALMGNQPGLDTFRIGGRTASLQSEGKQSELSIFLDSGAILKLETSSKGDGSELRTFAEALKISDLDSYLRGQS